MATAADEKRVILVDNLMKKDLDKDGVLSAIYKIMNCPEPGIGVPCRGVPLPDTLFINNKVITDWVYSDPRRDHQIVTKKKRPGGWRAKDVMEALTSESDGTHKVVAQFLYKKSEGSKGRRQTTMEYLTRQTLEEKLSTQSGQGILQRFVIPKSASNEVMRVIWTPSIVLMERRQNVHSYTDRSINIY